MQKVEGRENANIYRDVFRKIIKSYIEKLLKQKESGKDIKIELKDKDTNTESKNNNNKDGNEDDFRDFEDNTFLESEKSKYRSEDYIENEIDNKENNEDKD